MPPVIDKQKCSGCSKCVDACQNDVFFGSKKREVPNVAYPEECWHCNACVSVCPAKGAIQLRLPLPLMLIYKG